MAKERDLYSIKWAKDRVRDDQNRLNRQYPFEESNLPSEIIGKRSARINLSDSENSLKDAERRARGTNTEIADILYSIGRAESNTPRFYLLGNNGIGDDGADIPLKQLTALEISVMIGAEDFKPNALSIKVTDETLRQKLAQAVPVNDEGVARVNFSNDREYEGFLKWLAEVSFAAINQSAAAEIVSFSQASRKHAEDKKQEQSRVFKQLGIEVNAEMEQSSRQFNEVCLAALQSAGSSISRV